MLATSSEKGTVIRVWSIPNAEKLYQFRRGTREAKIYSMNFNLVGTLLAVSSAHDTVHIFKLGNRGNGVKEKDGTWSPASYATTSSFESVDTQQSVQGLDGGYDAFVEKMKSNSVSYVIKMLLNCDSDNLMISGQVCGGNLSK